MFEHKGNPVSLFMRRLGRPREGERQRERESETKDRSKSVYLQVLAEETP